MNTNKRTLIIAGVLLVVVLVGGVIAYNALSSAQRAAEASSATSASSSTPLSASETSSDASSAADKTDAPQLSSYDATVYTTQGEPVTLTQIANGKPLVINFWATWCPYCVQEMGDYLTLYKKYGDKVSFAFLDSIDDRRGETAEKAAAWLNDNGYGELPLYLDTDADAAVKFGASALPTTIVVASDGEIVSAAAGAIDASKMDAFLATLVG